MSQPTVANDARASAEHFDLKPDLERTGELHDRLARQLVESPDLFARVGSMATQQLANAGVRFETDKELPAALSALVLRRSSIDGLRLVTERLHAIVEQALNWLVNEPGRLEQYFPDHRRMMPYLARTPGLDSWQGYSRYDSVVTMDGRLKIIELNACCPAGFIHMPYCTQATTTALRELEVLPEGAECSGAVEDGVLVEGLLSIERRSAIQPGLVALLNDENGLRNELDLMAEAFRARSREVVIASASALTTDESGRVLYKGRPVSLSCNKIRVSTAESPNHCWKNGFEQRYRGFLEGLQQGAFVSVNNLVSATIAEDKSLLAMLRRPEFNGTLSKSDREFVDRFVVWTAPLKPGPVDFDAESVDLLPFIRRHRDRFVLKPANEGRGFGVIVGAECEQSVWEAACAPQHKIPYVVQEFALPATLPVPTPQHSNERQDSVVPMHLVLALAIVDGQYCGLFSRISPHLVTNVGRSGLIQSVSVVDD